MTFRGLVASVVLFPLLIGALSGPASSQTTTVTEPGEPLRVTIRPGEKAEPPPLPDLVIRSADGQLMFLYEWLTRPRAGRLGLFNLDFATALPDRETESLTLHTSDFGRILGKEYRYLDFEQISAEYGWSSVTQLASISRNRGVYLPATASTAFDPLDQSYGVLAFEPASVFGLREWWRGTVLGIE